MTIPARYENGVFRSLQDAPIKEGTVTAFAGNSTADSSPAQSDHMPFLIDSNVLIDVSRGHAAAIEYLIRLSRRLQWRRRSPWSPSIESTIG